MQRSSNNLAGFKTPQQQAILIKENPNTSHQRLGLNTLEGQTQSSNAYMKQQSQTRIYQKTFEPIKLQSRNRPLQKQQVNSQTTEPLTQSQTAFGHSFKNKTKSMTMINPNFLKAQSTEQQQSDVKHSKAAEIQNPQQAIIEKIQDQNKPGSKFADYGRYSLPLNHQKAYTPHDQTVSPFFIKKL